MNIKVKFEIIVAGLYLSESFDINGYKYNIKAIDQSKNIVPDDLIYYNPLLGYCLFPTKDEINYAYFEHEKNFKLNINQETFNKLSKRGKASYIQEQNLYDEIFDLEKELCLRTNNNIKFPIIRAIVYEENGSEIAKLIETSKLNIPPYLMVNIDNIKRKIKNQQRLNKWVDPISIKEAQQKFVRFNRALKFYYSSVSINDSATAFILLMSSLESLFNNKSGDKCPECHQDKYEIKKRISKYTAKILKDNEQEIEEKIGNLYKVRSNYVHGQKDIEITYENEIELREYVRKVLLTYWFIINKNPTFKTDKEIINFIDSDNFYDDSMIDFIKTIIVDD